MTPTEIAAARALCDAATPGPWTAGRHLTNQADSELMASSRTLVPQLLDEVERLQVLSRTAVSAAHRLDALLNRALEDMGETIVPSPDDTANQIADWLYDAMFGPDSRGDMADGGDLPDRIRAGEWKIVKPGAWRKP